MKTRHALVRSAVALGLALTGLVAQAGTVHFAWQYGPTNAVTVNIASPHAIAGTRTVQGGAFKVTLSGFADTRFQGDFEAYCVELNEFINVPGGPYNNYQIVSAASYFTGALGAERVASLTSLINYANNADVMGNATHKSQQTTALQLAIWNVVYETELSEFATSPTASLSSGSFTETNATAFRTNTPASGVSILGADALLNTARTYASGPAGYDLYVLQSVGSPGRQDQLIWLRNDVPEPASLALVMLALGVAGVATRRRG